MSDHTTIPTKQCSKCGDVFPATTDYFTRDSKKKSGLQARCKNCDREYRIANRERQSTYYRQYRVENRERLSEYYREWRAANHEQRLEYDRKYNASNREKHREWIVANHERIAEYHREYRKRNPARDRVKSHNRRARKSNLRADFTIEQQRFALDYFNNCCAICGRQFYDLFGQRRLDFDHWIPLSDPKCPGTVASNMIPMCGGIDGCNTRKGARDPNEWVMSQFNKRKARDVLARIEDYFDLVRG